MAPSEIGPEPRISESLSEEERQTDNAVELVAVIATLRHFETMECKICVVTDSEYVVLGAGGAARKWQQNGWVGSGALDKRKIVGRATGRPVLHG